MTNLRAIDVRIDRHPESHRQNEITGIVLLVRPDSGPPHEIHLDAWPDGELHLSLWADENNAVALWEGRINPLGVRLEVETRESTEAFTQTILKAPPPTEDRQAEVLAAELREVIDAAIPAAPSWLDEATANAQMWADLSREPWYVYTDSREECGWHTSNVPEYLDLKPIARIDPRPIVAESLTLLPLAPPADPLAEFRDLAPGAPLYDRASNRQIGTFESVSGDCVRLRSNVTGHIALSSGRALTRHERPIYEAATPGDCRP